MAPIRYEKLSRKSESLTDNGFGLQVSNIREVRARKGAVIAVTNEGNEELDNVCDFVIHLPATHDSLLPLLTILPMQLIAYQLATARKCSVDAPRHQSKFFANAASMERNSSTDALPRV